MRSSVDTINSLGRRLPIWVAYLLMALPLPWLFYLGVTGGLGPDPAKALEHQYGKLALQLLIVALAITPLRRLAGLNVLRFRRAIGLMAFVYVCAHMLVWAILDVQSLARVGADLVRRPYIIIGAVAALAVLPLAVTSNDWSVRRLRSKWRKLHRLAYPATFLAGVHYIMQAKGFQFEPYLYLAIIVALLVLRWRRKTR